MIAIIQYDSRRHRVYVLRTRIHHGFTGCLFIVIGVCLTLHDRRDYHEWFRDLLHPMPNPEGT